MASTSNSGDRGSFSVKRKTDAFLRLFRGENLELISRELGVTAATLSGGRDDFLAADHTALKSRPAVERVDEIARLQAKVGELTMDNELLGACSDEDLVGHIRPILAKFPSHGEGYLKV